MAKKQKAFTMAAPTRPISGAAPPDRRTVCRDAHSADQPISSSPSARTDAGIVSAAICSGALTAVLLPRRASPTRLQRIPQGQQVPTEARHKTARPSSTRRLEGRLGFSPRRPEGHLGSFNPPVLEEIRNRGLFFFVLTSNLAKRYVAVSESRFGRWGTGGAAWNTQRATNGGGGS